MSDRRPLRVDEVLAEEREALLDEVERAARLGSYVWVPGERVVWSKGFFRVLGVEGATIEDGHKAFLERVHPDDRARVEDAFQNVLATGDAPGIRYRILTPDGSTRVVEGAGAAVRDEGGRVLRIVGSIIDVTESHETGSALAAVHLLLSESQSAAAVGSYVFDLETQQLEWSEELYRILGVAPGTVPTAELSVNLVHPDDSARQQEWGMRVSRGEELPPLLARIVQPGGDVRYLESRARRIAGPDGSLKMVGVSIDVTARVELEEKLRHAARMESIGRLAAGVAHDFNNYLTVMGIQMAALKRAASPDSTLGELAQHAMEQCSQLTRQLLAFARRQPVSFRPVEIRDVLKQTLQLFARLAGPNVELQTSLGGEPLWVDGDAAQLESVFMNLAVNAQAAMPERGLLTVSADQCTLLAGDSRLGEGAAGGPYVRIRVEDNGTGIAPGHVPHVFEPYFTTKELGRGTGLGLASVYGIVQQHRGLVRVASSEIGGGAVFEVYLPRREVVPTAREPSAADASGLPRGLTLLVVEDLAPLRRVIADALRQAGARVFEAGDGSEALTLLESSLDSLDLLLTDVQMPRVNGLQLARAVSERRPDLPILFMTGYADATSLDRVYQEDCLIQKPFSDRELVDAIALLMRRYKAQSR